MKSAIFFDIDGTLITEDDRMLIPDSTRRAISMARENGCLTFINSGRTEFNISQEVRSLGFDGILCGCGTYIEYQGEVLLYHTQDHQLSLSVAQLLRELGVTPVYERRDGYFFDNKAVRNPELDHFMECFVMDGVRTDRTVEDSDFGFDKFVIWDNPGADMDRFYSELSPLFDIIDRGHGFYECVPCGFTKATAINVILRRTGINLRNSYAIGDSRNDLPMLLAVPNSIAMGGAEAIYPYVSYITDPIGEDGLFNALRHFGLI